MFRPFVIYLGVYKSQTTKEDLKIWLKQKLYPVLRLTNISCKFIDLKTLTQYSFRPSFVYFSSFTIYKHLHGRTGSDKKVDSTLKVRNGRGRITAKLSDVELWPKDRSFRLCSSKYKVSLKSTRISHRGFL